MPLPRGQCPGPLGADERKVANSIVGSVSTMPRRSRRGSPLTPSGSSFTSCPPTAPSSILTSTSTRTSSGTCASCTRVRSTSRGSKTRCADSCTAASASRRSCATTSKRPRSSTPPNQGLLAAHRNNPPRRCPRPKRLFRTHGVSDPPDIGELGFDVPQDVIGLRRAGWRLGLAQFDVRHAGRGRERYGALPLGSGRKRSDLGGPVGVDAWLGPATKPTADFQSDARALIPQQKPNDPKGSEPRALFRVPSSRGTPRR